MENKVVKKSKVLCAHLSYFCKPSDIYTCIYIYGISPWLQLGASYVGNQVTFPFHALGPWTVLHTRVSCTRLIDGRVLQ